MYRRWPGFRNPSVFIQHKINSTAKKVHKKKGVKYKNKTSGQVSISFEPINGLNTVKLCLNEYNLSCVLSIALSINIVLSPPVCLELEAQLQHYVTIIGIINDIVRSRSPINYTYQD